MKLEIQSTLIPGTIMDKKKMGDVTGLEFLDKIFFITNGIMLSQIREIAGIDGSTLQNWTKRGWVASAHCKRYDKNQLARILIINMMRDSMQLERIAQLLTYVNGRAGDESDDIIPESELYDYLCRVIDVLVRDEMPSGADSLNDLIRETLANYEERTAGAAKRLEKACGIIIMAYYATLVRQKANRMLDDVFQK
jgi:DNA-binding transcriptional MerR regulator